MHFRNFFEKLKFKNKTQVQNIGWDLFIKSRLKFDELELLQLNKYFALVSESTEYNRKIHVQIEFHDAREINIPCEESLRRDAARESTNDGETWRYTPLEISTYGC